MDAETIERSIRKRLEAAIAEIEHDFAIAGQLVLARAVDGDKAAWIGTVLLVPEPAQ